MSTKKINLTISYHQITHDWYVGRIYSELHKVLSKDKRISLKFIDLKELSKKHNFDDSGYHNNRPSIFNSYNLLIYNENNNKTFLHSFNDHSPVILDNIEEINKIFNLILFSCSSSLTEESYKKYSKFVEIKPSFYILENFSDHSFIEKYRGMDKNLSKLYFNGLTYGQRGCVKRIMENSLMVDFKDKNTHYKDKDGYYKELSQYKYGLSLNGAAKICYRDLEYFGMGILNFREKLKIKLHDPIIENVHYFNIFDNEINSIICDIHKKEYIKEKLEHNIMNIIKNEDVDLVVKNSQEWFIKNVLPENQINILYSFLNDFQIFD